MPVKGVDISYSNGDVDFSALQKAGVKFVLIRCGYGSDYVDQDDEQFFANVRKAEAASMPWGAYLYSYALTTAQAASEADHALRLLRQAGNPAYGIWFDMEDGDKYKEKHGMPSNGTLVEICKIFCDKVAAAGYYTGIYANLNWLETKLSSPELDKYDKWVAQWNPTCDYKKPYGIWQYTDCLSIAGDVFDGNYAYKDYPSMNTAKEDGERRYNKVSEIPGWAQPTIKKLCEKGLLSGNSKKKDENGYPADLDLSLEMIRTFVINDNAGLYD